MKGISTILATILIVIIVVAMISLTYTFATNLFGSATKPAETSIDSTTQKIDKRVSFVVDPSCLDLYGNASTWQVSFSLRHEGATYSIKQSEITAIFNNAQEDVSGSWISGDLAPGSVKSLSFTNTTPIKAGSTYTLTISAPASPISEEVTC
jgi:FlaG/FlaF family flagellin (archaellin)